MDFTNIEYLKAGRAIQRRAYDVLTRHSILNKLSPFDPVLVGTIPINIDIENSDLDIICHYKDKEHFAAALTNSFGNEKGFVLWERSAQSTTAIVARFEIDGFTIEIFGQGIPTRQQMAYRHMLIEHRLLMERGEDFRQQVIVLKRRGIKTEPAFGILLGLTNDPYTELLDYERCFGGQSHEP
jgi:hypothetical protein